MEQSLIKLARFSVISHSQPKSVSQKQAIYYYFVINKKNMKTEMIVRKYIGSGYSAAANNYFS